jgi:hypothetical protein
MLKEKNIEIIIKNRETLKGKSFTIKNCKKKCSDIRDEIINYLTDLNYLIRNKKSKKYKKKRNKKQTFNITDEEKKIFKNE